VREFLIRHLCIVSFSEQTAPMRPDTFVSEGPDFKVFREKHEPRVILSYIEAPPRSRRQRVAIPRGFSV